MTGLDDVIARTDLPRSYAEIFALAAFRYVTRDCQPSFAALRGTAPPPTERI